MGCCDSCGQVILVIINLLFSVIGILLLAFACVVRFGGDFLDTYLQDAYNAFENALREADIADDVSISELNIGDLLSDATIAFIVIGAFFFCLGIAGCIGACCKVKCLLIVYMVVLGVVFLGEVVLVVLLFTIQSTVDGWVKDPLVEKLEEDYHGMNASDSFSLVMNFVMHEFDCCGIDSYTEFETATGWDKTLPDNKTLKVPLICCRNTTDESCGQNPNSNNSYIDTACYSAWRDWITDQTPVLAGVGAGVAAVQLVLILFSIVVCCNARKHKDEDGFDDDIPIQPYQESDEAKGHRNMYYQESPPTHRSNYEYDRTGRTQPSAPTYQDYPGSNAGYRNNQYDHVEPYRGRTDYYTGPPDGYRSGGHKR